MVNEMWLTGDSGAKRVRRAAELSDASRRDWGDTAPRVGDNKRGAGQLAAHW